MLSDTLQSAIPELEYGAYFQSGYSLLYKQEITHVLVVLFEMGYRLGTEAAGALRLPKERWQR
jgi:hypothetical protein